ncbi:hypothetical protein C8J57DRAFT_1256635 [Mycena rebaudengoi]|nr:hypothetical protein C8J57DRAFT_1256635 [Mycena rebaudengoi]
MACVSKSIRATERVWRSLTRHLLPKHGNANFGTVYLTPNSRRLICASRGFPRLRCDVVSARCSVENAVRDFVAEATPTPSRTSPSGSSGGRAAVLRPHRALVHSPRLACPDTPGATSGFARAQARSLPRLQTQADDRRPKERKLSSDADLARAPSGSDAWKDEEGPPLSLAADSAEVEIEGGSVGDAGGRSRASCHALTQAHAGQDVRARSVVISTTSLSTAYSGREHLRRGQEVDERVEGGGVWRSRGGVRGRGRSLASLHSTASRARTRARCGTYASVRRGSACRRLHCCARGAMRWRNWPRA